MNNLKAENARLRDGIAHIRDIAAGRDQLDGFPRAKDEKQRRLGEIEVFSAALSPTQEGEQYSCPCGIGKNPCPRPDGKPACAPEVLASEQSAPRASNEDWIRVPPTMTADMINAWSNGPTISTDEIARRTPFQEAWTRVLAALPLSHTESKR